MSEAGQSTTENPRATPLVDEICGCIRKGLEAFADAITPPESACGHFREARIEVLRGIREIIDQKIDRLSRRKGGGTRVVVE